MRSDIYPTDNFMSRDKQTLHSPSYLATRNKKKLNDKKLNLKP